MAQGTPLRLRARRVAAIAALIGVATASLMPSAQIAQLGLAPLGPVSMPEPLAALDGPEPQTLEIAPLPEVRPPVTRRPPSLPPDAREAPPESPQGEQQEPEQLAFPSPDAEDAPGAPSAPQAPVWMIPGAMPPLAGTPAPSHVAPRTTDPDVAGKLLARAQRQRDKVNGIDVSAGSTIAAALADSSRQFVPGVSRGLLRASIGSDGKLRGIEVLTFSDGTVQQWQRAARRAEERLAGRSFHLPSDFAHGAAVTVRVTSNLQLPSGSGRSREHRRVAPAPIPLELESQKPRWMFEPRYGSRTPLRLRGRSYPLETDISLPRIQMGDFPEDGELSSKPYSFGSSSGAAVRGTFDVSDIGAHPQRIVDISFVTEPLTPPLPSLRSGGS